jgi:hypothetical protein
MRLRRLPARYGPIVLPLLLTLVMTCIVSGVSTLVALGFTWQVLRDWPAAWVFSWAVAFPTMLVVLPAVRRLVARVVEPPAP